MEVVLIDDDPVSNMIHSRLIGSVLTDFEVQIFTEPMHALTHLKHSGPALTLLDINMPGMSAWDCLDFMKEQGILTDVVILSSSIDPRDREKAARYPNVKHFFNKPLSKESIRNMVEDSQR